MDRKDLIRQYKETRQPMGVFRVRNTVSGRALIGTSVNLPAILNRHRAALRMGAHDDKALQKDWNDHGADTFEFEILDELKPHEDPNHDPTYDLKELEALWREKLS